MTLTQMILALAIGLGLLFLFQEALRASRGEIVEAPAEQQGAVRLIIYMLAAGLLLVLVSTVLQPTAVGMQTLVALGTFLGAWIVRLRRTRFTTDAD